MKTIKMVGHKNNSEGDAQDSLAGIQSIPGFIATYIESKEWRVVSFHARTEFDSSPLPKGKGMSLVELVVKK